MDIVVQLQLVKRDERLYERLHSARSLPGLATGNPRLRTSHRRSVTTAAVSTVLRLEPPIIAALLNPLQLMVQCVTHGLRSNFLPSACLPHPQISVVLSEAQRTRKSVE